MKCIDCYNEGCLQRAYTADAECVFEQLETQEFDWQSFRAEAAKDILCALIPGYNNVISPERVNYSIMIVDELIKELKEKEEK
jgi:hypothetical protein